MSGKDLISFSLFFRYHKGGGVSFAINEDDQSFLMFPKSEIEVDGIQCKEDFDNLIRNEELDVYLPMWMAEERGLI